jgi:hypothetical protein
MVRLTDQCPQEHREGHAVPVGEVPRQHPGLLVLECECRAKLVLGSEVAALRSPILECGICGERLAGSWG